MLANDNTRAARDFYLLLMVYVNYFCFPVLSFFLNGLSRFGNSVQSKYSKRANFVYIAVAFFMEDKEYISKLPFSQKEQVEFNFYQETYIEKPCCYSSAVATRFFVGFCKWQNLGEIGLCLRKV